MTRSTLSPLRRFTAAVALAGVAGLGGLVAAPAAQADDQVVSAAVVDAGPLVSVLPEITDVNGIGALPSLINRINLDGVRVESPLPDAPVTFVLGRFTLTLDAAPAQEAQRALAAFYKASGYAVIFTNRGMLVI